MTALPSSPRGAERPAALTIAGSDSGGGAGIQADLRTFASHGVAGTCAVTALTAQDTRGVAGSLEIPAEFVALQVRTVLADVEIAAAKSGMLAVPATVSAVAECIREWREHRGARGACLVVDPVMAAHAGGRLMAGDALPVLVGELLPLADLVTPNLLEAAALVGVDAATALGWGRREREDVARAIAELGVPAVLVKGGHSTNDRDSSTGRERVAADLLLHGGALAWLEEPWVETPHVHGTGCTLSAAITARVALGSPLPVAVAGAKRFLTRALREARPLGHGRGSPHQLWRLDALLVEESDELG